MLLGVGGSPRTVLAAELTASGPAACPDAAELIFRVERAIGMPLEHAAPLRFDVRFEARPASYSARLTLEASDAGSSSGRELGARGCAELADAVAVAIALALGSKPAEASALPEAEAAAAQPAVVSAAAPPPDEAPRPEPAPSEAASTLSSALAVSLVGDAGSLPGVGLGLGLGGELRATRFALRAAGTLLFDRHVALPGAGAGAPGADMSLALGSLSACTSPFGGADVAVVCGGWELGRIEAVGTGVQERRRGAALWSAPRVDLTLSWGLERSSLRVFGQVTAAAPLERDDFYLRDLGTVHRAPAVVGRLAIGVDVGFE